MHKQKKGQIERTIGGITVFVDTKRNADGTYTAQINTGPMSAIATKGNRIDAITAVTNALSVRVKGGDYEK